MKTALPTLRRVLTVCMVLACAALVNLQQAGAGLLTNDGAETGDLTGWTVDAGNFLAVTNVGSNLLLPKSGSYFFRADGNGHSSQMHQDVGVSAYAAIIDAGIAVADLELWMTNDGPDIGTNDIPNATLEYYDAGSTLLGSDTTNFVGLRFVWVKYAINELLPIGTRNIRVVLDGEWKKGGTDAYFDNINLNVIPEPSTVVLLGFGGLGLLVSRGGRRRRKDGWDELPSRPCRP